MSDRLGRLEGARTALGVKTPVRAATTANLTLSGFQTIDGVVFASTDAANGYNMRVLVKNQTTTTANGIYTVESGVWERSKDFDGNTDWVAGTIIMVASGTTNAATQWRVSSADPPAVGTSAIAFTQMTGAQGPTGATGATGAAATIAVGAVTTGAAGSSAIITNVGSSSAAIFDFTIPRGNTGATGAGTGDLLAANNLSDVATPYTAHDNLSKKGADVASAGTTNLTTATGNLVDITGTTTITAITLTEGFERTVRFTGILTLTNGASLVLPGGANITTAAGDYAILRGYAAGVVRCVNYERAVFATAFSDIKQAATDAATGVVELATPAEAGTGTDTSRAVTAAGLFVAAADVASAGTCAIGAAASQRVRITGTTGITSFGTIAAGIYREGYFAGILTLTHHATALIIPGGANVTTAAEDRFGAMSLGGGNWIVMWYQRASGIALVDAGSTAASQAEQEAAASTAVMVTPGRQHFHPSAAKAWVRFNSAGTVAASYNITSVTDSGIGDWTINIGTDFSSVNYCGVAFGGWGSGATMPNVYGLASAAAAGTFTIHSARYDGVSAFSQSDPGVAEIYAAFFGDHA